MKKTYKLSVAIIIAVLMCLIFQSAVSANEWETYDYSRFDSNTYLYDIGGNFKNIDIEYYNDILKDMKSTYGITYTFFIVNDYNDSAFELSDNIWANTGYGGDYMAVVISVKNRDLDVYTLGKGIMVMNDAYVEGMLDSLVVSLADNDWDGALMTYIDLAAKMTESYNLDTGSVTDRFGNTIVYRYDYNYDYDYDYDYDYGFHYKVFFHYLPVGNIILISLVTGLIISLVIVFIEIGKHKPVKKAVNADYYVKDENVRMSVVHDSFIRSHETRTRVSSDSSGGGSGRSGGSTRTSSSGRSSGGGSRKF